MMELCPFWGLTLKLLTAQKLNSALIVHRKDGVQISVSYRRVVPIRLSINEMTLLHAAVNRGVMIRSRLAYTRVIPILDTLAIELVPNEQ